METNEAKEEATVEAEDLVVEATTTLVVMADPIMVVHDPTPAPNVRCVSKPTTQQLNVCIVSMKIMCRIRGLLLLLLHHMV